MPPDLPASFKAMRMPVINWSNTPLYRTFKSKRGLSGALYFGANATERFDDPRQKFGICYLGTDLFSSFIECFRQRNQLKAIDQSELTESSIASVKIIKSLRLLDITGKGLAQLGQTNELTASTDKQISQEFAGKIYEHPDHMDGILYRARHDPDRQCIALYDRAKHKIKAVSSHRWIDCEQVSQILDHYDLGLI